jgi:FKBP-type peptidyl-prolyl cis-trans isomerase
MLIAAALVIAQPATQPAQAEAGTGETTQPEAGKTWKSPGGVQIKQVAEPVGAMNGDIVSVHYTGRLTDGTEFDSSVKRGQPITFPLGQGRVIRGWEEGLQGMQVGEKRQLTIPPNLAYGEQGQGPIPANSTLVFDVELVGLRRNQ